MQMTRPEFLALWAALAAYVENGQCNTEAEAPHAADPLLEPAEALLVRFEQMVALPA